MAAVSRIGVQPFMQDRRDGQNKCGDPQREHQNRSRSPARGFQSSNWQLQLHAGMVIRYAGNAILRCESGKARCEAERTINRPAAFRAPDVHTPVRRRGRMGTAAPPRASPAGRRILVAAAGRAGRPRSSRKSGPWPCRRRMLLVHSYRGSTLRPSDADASLAGMFGIHI
jgi:hypothetical protein